MCESIYFKPFKYAYTILLTNNFACICQIYLIRQTNYVTVNIINYFMVLSLRIMSISRQYFYFLVDRVLA